MLCTRICVLLLVRHCHIAFIGTSLGPVQQPPRLTVTYYILFSDVGFWQSVPKMFVNFLHCINNQKNCILLCDLNACPRRLRSANTRTLLVGPTCTNFGDSLQCSWTSSLELSADGPQTTGLVMQPFQTVTVGVFIWSSGPKHSMNPRLTVF